MATVFFGLLPDSGAGEATLDSAKITRRYLVQLDSFALDADAACNVAGIPAAFDAHPTVTLARVRRKSASRVGNSLYWQVEVEYSTPEKGQDEEENEDPLEDKPTMSISYEDREEVITGTLDSDRTRQNGIRNSAGELFDPPPMRTVSSLVLTIGQNYGTNFNAVASAVTYMDCINSDTFLGLGPKTCKICSVSPKTETRQVGDEKKDYLHIEWTIKVKPTWDLELLDYGSYYLDDGKKVEFKTDDAHPYQGLLNGSGEKVADGGSAVFLPAKQVYTKTAFSALNLPSSLSAYKFV